MARFQHALGWLSPHAILLLLLLLFMIYNNRAGDGEMRMIMEKVAGKLFKV